MPQLIWLCALALLHSAPLASGCFGGGAPPPPRYIACGPSSGASDDADWSPSCSGVGRYASPPYSAASYVAPSAQSEPPISSSLSELRGDSKSADPEQLPANPSESASSASVPNDLFIDRSKDAAGQSLLAQPPPPKLQPLKNALQPQQQQNPFPAFVVFQPQSPQAQPQQNPFAAVPQTQPAEAQTPPQPLQQNAFVDLFAAPQSQPAQTQLPQQNPFAAAFQTQPAQAQPQQDSCNWAQLAYPSPWSIYNSAQTAAMFESPPIASQPKNSFELPKFELPKWEFPTLPSPSLKPTPAAAPLSFEQQQSQPQQQQHQQQLWQPLQRPQQQQQQQQQQQLWQPLPQQQQNPEWPQLPKFEFPVFNFVTPPATGGYVTAAGEYVTEPLYPFTDAPASHAHREENVSAPPTFSSSSSPTIETASSALTNTLALEKIPQIDEQKSTAQRGKAPPPPMPPTILDPATNSFAVYHLRKPVVSSQAIRINDPIAASSRQSERPTVAKEDDARATINFTTVATTTTTTTTTEAAGTVAALSETTTTVVANAPLLANTADAATQITTTTIAAAAAAAATGGGAAAAGADDNNDAAAGRKTAAAGHVTQAENNGNSNNNSGGEAAIAAAAAAAEQTRNVHKWVGGSDEIPANVIDNYGAFRFRSR